jgi:tRNA nucleotidyltransferase (CCA-adding enzyme)
MSLQQREWAMDIITSHERTDMDALAAIYAANLLYPGYIALLPQKLNQNVRDFTTLYREALPFVDRTEVHRGHIEHLVIVDALSIAQLRGMDEHTQVLVIDHHLPQEPMAPQVTVQTESVGATTTMLAEELQRKQIALTNIGASLMLMGIYEDTGSLTYLTTTARDARIAAWLLECGADLELVAHWLSQPLNADQRNVLSILLSAARVHRIRGRDICIAGLTLEHYVDELSGLVHQVMAIYESEACFMLIEYEGNTQIIARSTSDAVNVALILTEFGGGGHSKAAAALVHGASFVEVSERLVKLLAVHVVPPILVSDIMANNVHTLNLNITAQDAAALMRRYGHEGFPVLEEGRLLGILTRRDVDRALHHGLGKQPIKSLLHSGPVAVSPNDPVDEVRRVMLESDLGQVPVVEDERFVGIVTRTDLIKLLAPKLTAPRLTEMRRLLNDALPPALSELLFSARDAAQAEGASLYLVGGFVRDLLLGQPTVDLDLVVEGNAIAVAERLAVLRGGRIRSHNRFGTAKVLFNNPPADTPESLDLVTARTEFYERPTALPQVEWSSIRQDLYRRDFTINTMAICLDRERYGELLDYYGGERDLQNGQVRVLHNLSFVEDPTRILRAVRFEQRLAFQIEKRTAELIDDAVELLDHVTGERLRHELFLLLAEAQPEKGLERLEQFGALVYIHPSLRFNRDLGLLFSRLRERVNAWQGQDKAPDLEHCYLALLTSRMDPRALAELVARLHIGAVDARLLEEVSHLRASLDELKAPAMLPSAIYRMLAPHSREARFVLSVVTESELVRERLDLYERELAIVRPQVDGDDLRSLGLPPGPIYSEILNQVHMAILDQQVSTNEEQQALLERLVQAAHRR